MSVIPGFWRLRRLVAAKLPGPNSKILMLKERVGRSPRREHGPEGLKVRAACRF